MAVARFRWISWLPSEREVAGWMGRWVRVRAREVNGILINDSEGDGCVIAWPWHAKVIVPSYDTIS